MNFQMIARIVVQNNGTKFSPNSIQLQKNWIHTYNAFQRYSLFTRSLFPNFLGTVRSFQTSSYVKQKWSMYFMLKNNFKKIPTVLKANSVNIVRNCTEQCEFVIAHRIRRSQQIFSLYTKLWDEVALRQFIRRLRRHLARRGKEFLLGAGIVSAFNWEKERIKDEDILRYSDEMTLIEFLRKRRDACTRAKQENPSAENMEVCKCPACSAQDSEWVSFIEKDNLVVWKREDADHRGQGLYSYKMYGRYDDVTANDFLEAQVDLDYRQTWDSHAVTLKLIDSEPSTHSDVIYWETKWPKLFSNRDYVFKRRFYIDKERKQITLVNRSTEHPDCPVRPSKQRVTEYWSYMVIKPYTELNKPGLEFSLTYFDNPGISMPSSLSLWVSVTGMPDFLEKLHLAAIGVSRRRRTRPTFIYDEDEDDDDEEDQGPPPPYDPNDPCSSTPSPSSDTSPSRTSYLERIRSTLLLF